MKRVCSWCNQEIGTSQEVWSGTDQLITHGICEAYAVDVLTDLETVEVYSPKRHQGRILRQTNSLPKLLDWPRPH
jgi:hypothetical protein